MSETENQVEMAVLKVGLHHLMHMHGMTKILKALIEIHTEYGEKYNEEYQRRLAQDFQRTLDTYEQRYELP